MELFNEVKNPYYTCVQYILNDMNEGKVFGRKEIQEYLDYYTFDPETDDKRLVDYKIQDKLPFIIKDGRAYPYMKKRVPIRLTTVEIDYLKNMLMDTRGSFLLSKDNLRKLDDKVFNKSMNQLNEFYVERNVDENGDDITSEELIQNIRTIIKAIKENKNIIYTNNAANGKKYDNVICTPYKIMYSNKAKVFQLIAIPNNEKRIILMNISRLSNVKITSDGRAYSDDIVEALLKEKKNLHEPIILEVEDKNNSIERCFSMFSCYHREAYIDQNTKKHIMKIFYYTFEEQEIVKDILSLGDAVIVKAPDNVREKVIERIKKAYFA